MNQQPIFQIKEEESKERYGRLVIEPLEQGYGQTLGSSLRRVLLSSLPGAAITQVAVSGLKHQFGTIKGVKEDGVDLILNIKKLRVQYEGEKPARLELSASGKGEVRADQIKLSTGVIITNPDLLIATLADSKSKLEIDMQVESGVGYSPADDRKTNKVGLIPVDADFSPITRVTYKVDETRVGRLTNYDKLTLEIWTDGSINPSEALKKAAITLVDYFNQVANPLRTQGAVSKQSNVDNKTGSLSVEELGLPTRIANALTKAGFETVEDLLTADRIELAKVRNMGDKSIKIIETALREKGINWEKVR